MILNFANTLQPGGGGISMERKPKKKICVVAPFYFKHSVASMFLFMPKTYFSTRLMDDMNA